MEASAVLHFKQNQTGPVHGGKLEEATPEGKAGRQGIIYEKCEDKCFKLTAERLEEVNELRYNRRQTLVCCCIQNMPLQTIIQS